jgi:hypothetical protein
MEKNEMGKACSAYKENEMRVQGFWWGTLKERDHLVYPGIDGRMILGWFFSEWDVGLCTGLTWLRIGTVGGHL